MADEVAVPGPHGHCFCSECLALIVSQLKSPSPEIEDGGRVEESDCETPLPKFGQSLDDILADTIKTGECIYLYGTHVEKGSHTVALISSDLYFTKAPSYTTTSATNSIALLTFQ